MTDPYAVEFLPEADDDLSRLSADVRARVLERIRWLAAHFDEVVPEPLSGRMWRRVLKFRVGDYRILYTASRRRRSLTIHVVGHRRDIYR